MIRSMGGCGNTFVFHTPTISFQGDGQIHKTSIPGACTPGVSIPFGDGPGGSIQDNVGALDIDPDDGHLWVAGNRVLFGQSWFYKLNRTNGAVLQSCTVPAADISGGNTTLAVAKLPGLSGSGTYLLTDAAESDPYSEELLAADVASCVGGGSADIVTTYQIMPTTGIDFEGGKLISVLLHTIYDLGGPPFNSINSTM